METRTAARTAAWIGIDVSKRTLHACLIDERGTEHPKCFTNDPAGFAKQLTWARGGAPERACHFALEATACYSEAVALFLCEQNQRVSVLNPARVHYAALAAGAGNKTDEADARGIAHFCRKENPPPWQPPSSERRALADLVRRREDLLEIVQKEKNRQEQTGLCEAAKQSLGRSVRSQQKEIARVEKAIAAHLKAHPAVSLPPSFSDWRAASVSVRSAAPSASQSASASVCAE